MSKMLFFDLETTGTNPAKNGIHQISGKIIINGNVEDEFNIHIKPNPLAKIEDEALAVAGITSEDLQSDKYVPFNVGYNMFVGHLQPWIDKYDKKDKMFLAGYNVAAFDAPFLRGLFLQNNDPYFGSWFWSATVDVMILAMALLMEDRPKMENFKQGTVAKYLGIDVEDDKLHDAMYDIDICYKIYLEVMKRLKGE